MRREHHGKRHTRLYSIWANMKTRCYNPNDPHYPRWGGKGVRICDEWRDSFQAFHDWAVSNGYEDGLTIDRVDCSGDYSPSNCRWATVEEQNRNKPNVRKITFEGETLTIGQWTKRLGLGKETIRERLKRGWSESEAVSGRREHEPVSTSKEAS